MTAAQRLREEGRLEGRQEGLQPSRSLLLRVVQQRFGDQLDPLAEQHLRAASLEQIEAWLLCALSAASLAELLGDDSSASA